MIINVVKVVTTLQEDNSVKSAKGFDYVVLLREY